jgi:hypothetical protein
MTNSEFTLKINILNRRVDTTLGGPWVHPSRGGRPALSLQSWSALADMCTSTL